MWDMPIATVNPATEETEREFAALSDEELDARLSVAVTAFGDLRGTSFEQRGRWAMSAADLLEAAP